LTRTQNKSIPVQIATFGGGEVQWEKSPTHLCKYFLKVPKKKQKFENL